ncbi:ArsR/SmtB family transcription factor [Neorhodopirellula pilleata]|uniref:Transcriptional repressor SdpR n=1 Tax=Neorhodopirellula pilleata TaxID=2714738 RepID=A0A5C6A135_9BACT|nr:metalloregulator ArsR/SmtB family transcription factor [Neorhodopirellula pilleata]TWT93542.1 Transcriptional repressor SdpR [Neorhodopirellula pilleata]
MARPANREQEKDERCATYLKAVGDPIRLKVIRALQMGPLSVGDVAELLELEIGTVSHHLRVLYHAGIVQTRREGKFIYYSLDSEVFHPKRKKDDSVLDFGCCRLDVS